MSAFWKQIGRKKTVPNDPCEQLGNDPYESHQHHMRCAAPSKSDDDVA